MTHSRLVLVSVVIAAIAAAGFAFAIEGSADDQDGPPPVARQPHPEADALSDEVAAAIAGVQSHARYDEIRAAYVACMQASYPGFTGEFDTPVRLSDGTIYDRDERGGRVVTDAVVELLDIAADCRDSSGYTSLLSDAGLVSHRLQDVVAATSARTQFLWECVTAEGHDISRPVGDALPLPLYPDSGDPELVSDLRSCLEEWNGTSS